LEVLLCQRKIKKIKKIKKENKKVHKKFLNLSNTLSMYNEYIDKQVNKKLKKIYFIHFSIIKNNTLSIEKQLQYIIFSKF